MQLVLAVEVALLALFLVKACIANIERDLLRPPPVGYDDTD